MLTGKPTVRALTGRASDVIGALTDAFVGGDKVVISCPITNMAANPADATVKCHIYEGAVGDNKILKTLQQQVSFAAGEAKTIEFSHTCKTAPESARGVVLEVEVGGEVIATSHPDWDDVFTVEPGVAEIEIPWTMIGLIGGGAAVAGVIIYAAAKK